MLGKSEGNEPAMDIAFDRKAIQLMGGMCSQQWSPNPTHLGVQKGQVSGLLLLFSFFLSVSVHILEDGNKSP